MLATANAREPLPSYTNILPPKENANILPPKENKGVEKRRRATLERRQEIDTSCEFGAGTAIAQDLGAGSGESPQAFSQLWDWADAEACQESGCTARKEHCVTAATGQDVCIQIDGSFPPGSRGSFIGAARGAFDRTVRTDDLSTGVIERGTNMVRLITKPGDNSGYDIEVQIYNKGSSGGSGSCPQTIKTVASAGAQVPEIGSMFGLVGFLCGGADSFNAMATG